MAVMIPSRPKAVENHGTPAYGYGPCSLSVTSMLMSAIERHSTSLTSVLEVSTAAARRVASRSSRRAARMARNTLRWLQPSPLGAVHGHHDGPVHLGRQVHLERGMARLSSRGAGVK